VALGRFYNITKLYIGSRPTGQVTIIFVVSVCLFVCAEFFSELSSIRFGSN